VLNDAGDATESLEEILVQHCRAGLAHYKYPRWFYFVTDLPKQRQGRSNAFG
jgi:acyl-coenzyme A synthetase/AMP-(fatty) acid ligase